MENFEPNGLNNSSDKEHLNLLLTCGSWRKDAMVRQLPRLLEPIGIHSLTAETGEEALEIIDKQDIHIAIVDLDIPLKKGNRKNQSSGQRVLQLLRRLSPQPPTIVIRPRQSTVRENARSLAQSMQEGAFTVVDRPAMLETLLDALYRVHKRYYAGRWPAKTNWNSYLLNEEEQIK